MRAVLPILALLLTGCATNGYSKFYTSVPGATPDKIAATRVGPPPAAPLVDRAPDFEGLDDVYARKGYALIGYSSFSGGRGGPEKDAIKQGLKLGADLVVVIDPKYEGSVTSNIPITTPTTTTSQTNSTATAYGSGGSATAFGTATTTTYGTRTTYVPMTVRRYEYGAVYFVKRRFRLGANYRELSDAERRQLQTNRGVYVNSVVDGSPAYEVDILPGDIIVALDGQPVNGDAGFSELLKVRGGRPIEFTIMRDGERLSKSVSLLD